MSSRFPRDDRDSRDNRYMPRDRTPPGSRYSDRRPSVASFGSSYSGRGNDYGASVGRDNVPRGPRGAIDSRLPPPSAGPRGRGFGGNTALRDFRDAPFGGDRAADRWRDGEYDRRDRRPSPPRGRTPAREREDSRDRSVKDIDTDRARRNSRDGPPSAGSNLSDPARTTTSTRGGFGRGRGRPDWEYRAPGRAFTTDDRDVFRPRSRSRGPRRERDRSVDSRDFDRRDDYRERREDERRQFRDREDDSYFKRDQPSRTEVRPAFESRASTASSLPQTPQTERPPSARASTAERASSGEIKREYEAARRASVISDQGLQKDRRDPVKPDVRAESSRYQQRAASPPPSVPQFGTFKPPSNVWINPANQNKPVPVQLSTVTTPQAPKAPTAAMKPHVAASPPTAPRADRLLEQSRLNLDSVITARNVDNAKALDISKGLQVQEPWRTQQSVSPRLTSATTISSREDAPPTSTLANRSPVPPAAPRAMMQVQTVLTVPIAPVSAELSPNRLPQVAAKHVVAGSPPSFPDNVPTGPRAERVHPPALGISATRSRPANIINRQPFAPQRTMNVVGGVPMTTIPVKRDATGDNKEIPHPESAPSVTQTSLDGERLRKVPRVQASVASRSTFLPEHHIANEVKTADGPSKMHLDSHAIDVQMEDASHHLSDAAENRIVKTDSSSEDEGMFDEDDFANHEARYMETRQRLIERRADPSSREFRSTTPLQQLSLLAAMRNVISKIDFKRPIPTDSLMVDEGLRKVHDTASVTPAPPDVDMEDTEMTEAQSYSDESPLMLSSPEPQLSARDPPTPLTVPEQYFGSRETEIAIHLKEKLTHMYEAEAEEQETLSTQYELFYGNWRRNTLDMDRARQQAEKEAEKESPKPPEAPPGPETPAIPMMTPTEGGRRAHKFASEYDLQRAMEQSQRDEEERRRKVAIEEGEANSAEEREVDIPDMLDPSEAKRRVFYDSNRLRDPKDAMRIFEFTPPIDTFTEEEDELLRKLYEKNLKAWGKIADAMREATGSTRTYKECINHYYSTKFDKPYKKPATGRGRIKKTVIKKTGRGRVMQTFTNVYPEGELVDGEGAVVQVTDSGRPRRAAAPKFGEKDDNPDSGLGTPGRTLGGTSADGSEPVGKAKRQKGSAQKGVKKTRSQPLAARPTTESPTKPDKVKKLPQTEQRPSMEPLRSIEGGDVPTPLPHQAPYLDNLPTVYPEQAELQPMALHIPQKERPRALSNQRTGASSYWSVSEANHFLACLAHFGSEDKAFENIAMTMQTKTTQMVRNHYGKLKAEGKHQEIFEAAERANLRIKRRENLGPPPAAVPGPKKRQDHQQPAQPRTLAPNTTNAEIIDLEKSPAIKPGVPPQQSPPSISMQRYAGLNYPSAGVQPATQVPFPTSTHTSAAPASQQQRQHTSGPPRGYFSDRPVGGQRGTLGAQEQPPIQVDRIQSKHDPAHRQSLAQQQDVSQLPMHPQNTRDEPVHRRSNPMYPGPGVTSQMQAHSREQERFAVDRRLDPIYVAPNARSVFQASEPFRHQPQPGPTPPAQQVVSAPPKEPSRRVNIMSMLNPEPEEDRIRKKEPEPAPIVPQQAPIVTQQAPPRPYSRPSMTYPGPSSTHSTPVTEVSLHDSYPTPAHRDSWPRQSYASQTQPPPAHSNSPHLQHQLGDRLRAAKYHPDHNILSDGMRPILTTPPPSYHSRTPSLATGSQLQPNPYSMVQPPASTSAQAPRPPHAPHDLGRPDSIGGHARYGSMHGAPPLDRSYGERPRDPPYERYRDQQQQQQQQDPRLVAAEVAPPPPPQHPRDPRDPRDIEYIGVKQRVQQRVLKRELDTEGERAAHETPDRLRPYAPTASQNPPPPYL